MGTQMSSRGLTYMPSPGDSEARTVTLIPGDGIGPEVCAAVEHVVAELKVPIAWERFPDLHGSNADGSPREDVPADVLTSIRRNKYCLKGVMYTPLSSGTTNTQSLNVQLRKDLDCFVNLVHAFDIPGLRTRHDNVDIAIIRENTEGEYSGLEHEVVPGVVESLKVITEEKSKRIAEYAFEYASMNNRRKVSAVHKANIMKQSDGLFIEACRKVAANYPNIEYEEMIVDNTCMQLVSKPEQFDVMVTPNLYGNLVANVAAGLMGGPGVIPGGNIGSDVAIFEQGARHVGHDIEGKGVANPTAILLSTAMLLRHMSLLSFADRLEKGVLDVIKEGVALTPDMGGSASTMDFANAVVHKASA